MDDFTELYCLMDDFRKEFTPEFKALLLTDGSKLPEQVLPGSGYIIAAYANSANFYVFTP